MSMTFLTDNPTKTTFFACVIAFSLFFIGITMRHGIFGKGLVPLTHSK